MEKVLATCIGKINDYLLTNFLNWHYSIRVFFKNLRRDAPHPHFHGIFNIVNKLNEYDFYTHCLWHEGTYNQHLTASSGFLFVPLISNTWAQSGRYPKLQIPSEKLGKLSERTWVFARWNSGAKAGSGVGCVALAFLGSAGYLRTVALSREFQFLHRGSISTVKKHTGGTRVKCEKQ